jgi:Zn-finger nucleic acid-binding protein
MPVCTQCNRETKAARDTCLYCGGPLAADTKAQLGCPRCSAAMRRDVVDGIELDLCDSCGGTWYDRGELEQHIAAPPTAADAPAPEAPGEFLREPDRMDTRYLKCPYCASPMTRKNWGRLSGIIVDICGPHGLFLDAGELEKIRDFETSNTKARATCLADWEQAQGDQARRAEQARNRKDLQREIQRQHVFFWGLFR